MVEVRRGPTSLVASGIAVVRQPWRSARVNLGSGAADREADDAKTAELLVLVRLLRIPRQTEVEGQVGGYLPIVLRVSEGLGRKSIDEAIVSLFV